MSAPMIDADKVAAAAAEVVSGAVPSVPGVVAGITTDRENIYLGAAGKRSVDSDVPMTTDTTFAIFSTTKALTATAALQLVESGDLDIDAPAKSYVPAIGELQVIEGFDDAGEPILRAPASDITTRQLLLHTAGFGYDFFNETYNRLATDHGQPSIVTATMESLTTPLLFDPGTQWEYGTNMDWCGLVVEAITGKRLDDVMAERIFTPLGMNSSSFGSPKISAPDWPRCTSERPTARCGRCTTSCRPPNPRCTWVATASSPQWRTT